ncbi:MAG: inorganic triphosphatase, partial [Salinarimonas sp.]
MNDDHASETATDAAAPDPVQPPAEPAAEPPAAAPAREVELKLELAPADWKRLARHPLLKEALAAAPKAKRMEATYFDTPDGRLRAKGVSLRIRRMGSARIQTAKAGGTVAAGLFDRDEIETPVAGDVPDLAVFAGTPLEPLFAKRKVREGLAPAFGVSVRRRTIAIAEDGFAAEMVVDEGTVTVGPRTEPLCEIELELRAGGPADLFAFARRIAQAVPARLGFRTKADRGRALAAGEGPRVVKKIEVALEPAMPAGAAFQAIARGCVAQLVANEQALRDIGAPGAIHQSRVALRRLRAAISLFRRVVEDDRR